MINAIISVAYRTERCLMKMLNQTHRGVQALMFNSEGELALLELRYLTGWHLPGGRCKRGEDPLNALLRELSEEIGAIKYEEITMLGVLKEVSHGVRCEITVFLIEGFVPRSASVRGFEVASIKMWDIDNLPQNSAVAKERLERYKITKRSFNEASNVNSIFQKNMEN